MPAKSHPPITIKLDKALAIKIWRFLLPFSFKLGLWLLRMIPTYVVLYGAWYYFFGPMLYGLFYMVIGAGLAFLFRLWRAALRFVIGLMVGRQAQ